MNPTIYTEYIGPHDLAALSQPGNRLQLWLFDIGLAIAAVGLALALPAPADSNTQVVAILALMYGAINIFAGHMYQNTALIDFTAIPALAALLALGPVAMIEVIVAGTALIELAKLLRRVVNRQPPQAPQYALQTITACTGLYGFAALAAYAPFTNRFPLQQLGSNTLPPIGLLLIAHALGFELLAVLRIAILRRALVPELTYRSVGRAVLLRLTPLPLAILVALVYHTHAAAIGNFALIMAVLVVSIWLLQITSRARAALERRLNELATLNRVGQALATNLSLDDLLETIYVQVQTICDIPTFYIALYDNAREQVSFPFVVEHYRRKTQPDRQLVYSLTEHIIRSRQPLVIADCAAERLNALGVQVEEPVPACCLGEPLIVGEEVIGVLLAQHNEREHAYSPADCRLLSTIATQAAIALRNAQLFQQTEAAAVELTELVETSRRFAASLDLASVAQTVVQQLINTTPADYASLYRWAAGQEAPCLLAHSPDATTGLADRLLEEQHNALQRVITEQHSATLALDSSDDDRASHALVMPLVVHGQTIGLITLWRQDTCALTAREQQLVEAIANQAATALQNAIIYSQTDATLRERVIELSAIEVISRRISATLDLETILDDMLAAALSTIGAQVGSCALVINPDQYALVARLDVHGTKYKTPYLGDTRRGVVGRVLSTKHPVVVADTIADPDYISLIPGMRSELCVPILRDEQPIGVFNFEDPRPNVFTESHIRFVNTLAEHAAIAIENARLFRERRRQIETLVSLRTLSLRLLSALDLQSVAAAIAEHAQQITHAQDACLYLQQGPEKLLSFAAHAGADGCCAIEYAASECYERAQQVVESGEPYYSMDVQPLSIYHAFTLTEDFEALACIPIQRAGQIFGVLEIRFTDSQYFSLHEVQALDVLANQAAVAIENIQLYQEVRAGRDQLQAILDSTREGMLLFDNHGRLLKANQAAEEMIGHSLSAYLGQRFVGWLRTAGTEQLHTLAGHTLYQLRQYVSDVVHRPTRITYRQFEQMRNGEPHYIAETGLPVLDRSNTPAGWLIVWRDITEERQLNVLREELSNMIVHDLRSPLTAIISSLAMVQDLMAEDSLDAATVNDVIQVAQNSGQNMLSLVQSLLDIARLEHNALALDRRTCSLADSVEYACDSVLSLAIGANIHLNVVVLDDLPLVSIDEDKIRRVLINLLDNALRHTPFGGKIDIEAEICSDEQAVTVCVIDTGPGIPPETRDRIFDKFTQLDQEALRGHKGTGLGLTFCKLAVEAHGGRIWVDEGPEGGAAFCFTLPAALPNKSLPNTG
ncbi:MAG: GAF domain-containing protein [Anaerolineae bacterium]|nr:GAF domain-containing protein [Anaerolineae bacterium]